MAVTDEPDIDAERGRCAMAAQLTRRASPHRFRRIVVASTARSCCASARRRGGGHSAARVQTFMFSYTLVSLVLVAAWMISLEFFATRDHKIIGSGSLEYKRITDATIRVFGLLAIIAFLTPVAGGSRLPAYRLPIGLALLLIGRWSWRQWLNRSAQSGEYFYRALLLGERVKCEHVAQQMERDGGRASRSSARSPSTARRRGARAGYPRVSPTTPSRSKRSMPRAQTR